MSATTQAVNPGAGNSAVRPGPLAFVRRHPIAVFLALVFRAHVGVRDPMDRKHRTAR